LMVDVGMAGLSVEADLYKRYGSDLVRFATGLVGPSDAQDAVSDAMVGLWKSRRLVEAANGRALMYRAVLASARSLQRSSVRRRLREARTAQSVVTHDPDIDPEVAAAVIGLSQQQRACVFLTYWEDLSVAEVADRLGIEEGSVKQHLFRARERLREVLGVRSG